MVVVQDKVRAKDGDGFRRRVAGAPTPPGYAATSAHQPAIECETNVLIYAG